MKHAVIPDTQCRPGDNFDFLLAAGRYLAEKQPDVIVHLGDHWDFPSLSRYESSASKGANARDILADVEAGNAGLAALEAGLRSGDPDWQPLKIMLRGNHEARVHRAIEAEPWLRGLMCANGPNDREHGWHVYPFLQPVEVDGVAYCHYFVRNANGMVMQSRRGMPSAKAMVVREGRSCTAGHQQGLQIHLQPVGGGKIHRGLIAGSFYEHDESYLTPQGNSHWRGILLKHEVHDGQYNLLEVSLDYLKRNYL
jgi:hypothetical protein